MGSEKQPLRDGFMLPKESHAMTKSATLNPKVFIASQESTRDECGQHLGRHAWITLQPIPGPQKAKAFCLSCADLTTSSFCCRAMPR